MATEADKVNTGALATIAAVLGFSVLGIAFAVTALVRHEEESLVDNRSQSARRPYDEMHAEQAGSLQNGVMPIETAMQKVVEGLKADPNSATPFSPEKDAGAAATETTDAGANADAAAEEADGAAPTEEGASDAAAPEKTEDAGAAPTLPTDAGAPKKKPKPTGGATPPAPPAPPTLPTPTAP